MLAGFNHGLGDFAVQGVAHHDGNNVNVGVFGHGPPVGYGLVVAVALGGVACERLIGVRDGGQVDLGKSQVIYGADLAPGVGVGGASHAGTDYCDVIGFLNHVFPLVCFDGSGGEDWAGLLEWWRLPIRWRVPKTIGGCLRR